jgi:hypothetical protein
MVYRLKIGDVFAIPTKIGFGFFQVTPHRNDFCGPLIRVIDFVAANLPQNIEAVASMPERFYCYAFVSHMANKKITEKLGNAVIPPWVTAYPPLIGEGYLLPNGGQQRWTIIENGKFIGRVDSLTDEQKKMSMDGVVNDKMLIGQIETNWRPELDPTRTDIRSIKPNL